MRRAGAAAAAVALLAAAGPAAAPAHPGHAIPTVDVGGFAYSPATLTVSAGDFVSFDWAGPDLDHSVTADAGQSESFDSDPGKAAAKINHPKGDLFPYYFAKAGTFAYHCKVHSFMHGKIVVQPSTRPPASANPAPRIAGLRAVVAVHRKLRVSFRLSERAGTTVRIRRGGAKRSARSAFRFMRSGRGSMKLSLRGLRPGRYAVTARAMDDSGKKSKIARAAFTLKAG